MPVVCAVSLHSPLCLFKRPYAPISQRPKEKQRCRKVPMRRCLDYLFAVSGNMLPVLSELNVLCCPFCELFAFRCSLKV